MALKGNVKGGEWAGGEGFCAGCFTGSKRRAGTLVFGPGQTPPNRIVARSRGISTPGHACVGPGRAGPAGRRLWFVILELFPDFLTPPLVGIPPLCLASTGGEGHAVSC